MGDAALRAGLARLVKDTFKDAPAAAAGAMHCLYGQDYGSLDADSLGERLGLITNLLSAMQANPAGEQLMESVLQRIQAGMDQLPSELLNDLVIDNNVVKVWEGDRERIVGNVDEKLAQAIDTAKDHAAARRKLQATAGDEPIYFSRDAAALAAFFDLAPEEMEAILKLFRGCFDGRGGFQKTSFEKKVPEFARYHKKIFQVLWEFLKDMPRRSDRLPFLNSLQLMIKEIQQPIQAVRTLLSDFVADPAQVSFPDRNAIMLSTQFLRTYNKEINVDIELTPEEVLRVQVGLDGKVMNYAAWTVNSDQKRFLTKVVSIRKRLMGGVRSGSGRCHADADALSDRPGAGGAHLPGAGRRQHRRLDPAQRAQRVRQPRVPVLHHGGRPAAPVRASPAPVRPDPGDRQNRVGNRPRAARSGQTPGK